MLTDEEKRELLDIARSTKVREDFRRLSEHRHNPFIVDGDVDMDRLLTFLTEYNIFINHTPKAFRRIVDRDMRL